MVLKLRTLTLPKPTSDEDLSVIHGQLKRFSLAELILATDNFSCNNMIGVGAFGKVYKGFLPGDGSVVAVKRLGRKQRNLHAGKLQFKTEVSFGEGTIQHQNLVRLRGFCVTGKERILVYPYFGRGSLASRLRDPLRSPSPPILDWPKRKQIALGIAKGICYLHHGCGFKMVHRDIKADNVLLDDEFEPVLCDFGLIKVADRNSDQTHLSPLRNLFVDDDHEEEELKEILLDESSTDDDTISGWFNKFKCSFTKTIRTKEVKYCGMNSLIEPRTPKLVRRRRGKWKSQRICRPEMHSGSSEAQFNGHGVTEVSTAVRGTIGHIAPEYLSTGKCSIKCDVYGYGIVLLELVSGQKAYDRARSDDHRYILNWAKRLVGDKKLESVVDPNLRGCYEEEEVEKLLQVALLCTIVSPEERPSMLEVIEMIEAIGRRLRTEEIESTRTEPPQLEPKKKQNQTIDTLHWHFYFRFNHVSVSGFLFISVCINCLLFIFMLAKC